MEKQTIIIGNYIKGFYKLEYDELYYTKAIQGAINHFTDHFNTNKKLKECIKFISYNTDYFIFLLAVAKKNIIQFQDKVNADKLVYEYSKTLFKNLDDGMFEQLNKESMAEHTFSNLMIKEFLKAEPLMKDIEKKIYESII